MANLGDFFELVFAAKVYQRLNPENIKNNKLKILKTVVQEDFPKEVLSDIKNFLIKNKDIIKNKKSLISDEITYINSKGVKDTIQTLMNFQSKISDVEYFIRGYEDPEIIKNIISINIIMDYIKNKKFYDTLSPFYKDNRDILDKLSKEYLEIPDKKDSFEKLIKNQQFLIIKKELEAEETFKNIFSKRKIELPNRINKILNFDVDAIPEVKELIKKRNSFLLNDVQELLFFQIIMVGETKIKGIQGKTDIEIILRVYYREKGLSKSKDFKFFVSLKFDSPKIETASIKKYERLNEYFDVQNYFKTSDIKKFKDDIIKLIFDNINQKRNDSLIKLTTASKNNIKRLDKKDLIKFLNELNPILLKKIKQNKILKILYDNKVLISLTERENDGKIEYQVNMGPALTKLMK